MPAKKPLFDTAVLADVTPFGAWALELSFQGLRPLGLDVLLLILEGLGVRFWAWGSEFRALRFRFQGLGFRD